MTYFTRTYSSTEEAENDGWIRKQINAINKYIDPWGHVGCCSVSQQLSRREEAEAEKKAYARMKAAIDRIYRFIYVD